MKVRTFDLELLIEEVKNHRGGKIKDSYSEWLMITDDRFILDIIKNGLKIDFEDGPPKQKSFPSICFNNEEKEAVRSEIDSFLKIRLQSEDSRKLQSSFTLR